MTRTIDSDRREEAYKILITASVTFACICVLGLCSCVPSFYSHVKSMRDYAIIDTAYCDAATRDINEEVTMAKQFSRSKAYTLVNRTRRTEGSDFGGGGGGGGGYASIAAAVLGVPFQECPACCKPGVRGPPGDPGVPGIPGANGPDGASGRPGTTPNASCIPERIFEPPPCLPCPQGPRGPPGHPGFPGEPGNPGIDGRPGYDGPQGPPGPQGPQGQPGSPGAQGLQGDKGLTPEGKLLPGPPGDSGDPGAWGLPGHQGQAGDDGLPGTPGDKGWPGEAGDTGDPGANGPAGPAGEAGPPGNPGSCVCQDTEVVVQDKYGQNPAPYGGYPGPALSPGQGYNSRPGGNFGGGGYGGGGGSGLQIPGSIPPGVGTPGGNGGLQVPGTVPQGVGVPSNAAGPDTGNASPDTGNALQPPTDAGTGTGQFVPPDGGSQAVLSIPAQRYTAGQGFPRREFKHRLRDLPRLKAELKQADHNQSAPNAPEPVTPQWWSDRERRYGRE